MQYIVVSEYEDSECIEIPQEEDETVLLTTLNGIFPKVCGLKYRSSESGAFRALRLTEGRFYKPLEGWSNTRFCCVFPKDNNKRKNEEETEKPIQKSKRLEGRKCTDLIVLNLGWNVDEEMLKDYFCKYGELVLVQVKRERETSQSKGFAFIRYVDYESQVLCLADKHLIDSRWCPVKIPFSKNEADKQEISKKIHLSYLSEEVTSDDIRNTFEQYGFVTEIFIPKPFRKFAFVTFDSCDVVQALIGHTFTIKGHNVTVGSAVPKVNTIKNNNGPSGPFPPMFNEMAMQNQAMQARYGMMNTFNGPWMPAGNNNGYEPHKGRGSSFNHGYSGMVGGGGGGGNMHAYMMSGNGNKSGQEAIQQGYANQDNMMQQAFYSQYQSYEHNHQQPGIAASTAINILNNPDVVAAIVAAANKSAVGHGKYGQ